MKALKQFFILLTLVAFFACSGEKKEDNEEDHSDHPEETSVSSSSPKSPETTAMTNIGATHVHIVYHAPSTRGRQVFGGLVAYDEVWVTGAHSATSIEFYNDVTLNGQKVEKGKYALFTIPNQTEWTLIINKNFDQHLADDYDQALDVVRVKVIPEKLSEIQEQLLYEVKSTQGNEGVISISWADVKISVDVKEL